MDKLAKVRAEVERRMLEDYNNINDEQDVIAQGVCAGILHFIDSMQEEPVSRTPADIEAAMQEVEEKSKAFTDAHKGENADTILAQMRGEEPVSEDLGEASKDWLRPQLDKSYAKYGESKMMEFTHFDGYAMLDAIEFGAEWQKEQDQKTIELAEDHAMLAGMEKMKEEMMEDVIDCLRIRRNKYTKKNVLQGFDVTHDVFQKFRDGDKLKIIVIKEE